MQLQLAQLLTKQKTEPFHTNFQEQKFAKQRTMIAGIGPSSLGVSAMHRFRKNTFPVGTISPSLALTSAQDAYKRNSC